MATTVLDIIKRSLRILRVTAAGETPRSEESNDAYEVYKTMLDSWKAEGLMLYNEEQDAITLTADQSEYTIGNAVKYSSSTGVWTVGNYAYGATSTSIGRVVDVDTANNTLTIEKINGNYQSGETLNEWQFQIGIGAATATAVASTVPDIQARRPEKMPLAVLTQSDIDYPLKELTWDQFQVIPTKTVTSNLPYYYYYDRAFPNATIKLYPIPTDASTLTVTGATFIGEIYGLTSVISLPPGYLEALAWNLAYLIAPEYGKNQAEFERRAMESKAVVKRSNVQVMYSRSDVPHDKVRGGYNFYIG